MLDKMPPARFAGLFLAFLVLSACFSSAAERPNILLIVSDDQGYNDLGSFGSEDIKTPHLDALAAGGVRLTSFYVSWPACTPSRGSLLTGRYPQRNGTYDMYRNEAPDYGYKYPADQYRITFERIGGMDTREVLLPKALKAGGYRSGIYGKWDLGIHKRFLPQARGFDDFYGFVNTGIDYYTHERYGVPSMFRNNQLTEEDKGVYCTTLFHREAMRFLKESPADEPFFLYVPYNAPHNSSALDPEIRSGVQAPDEWKAIYPEPKEPQYVTKDYRYAKNARVPTSQTKRRDYMAAVSCMDDSIGGLLEAIDRRGDRDNTIVIFFSDNGGSGGAINAPLRGGKGRMFEGGIRVPFIARWPERIAPGGVVDEFVTSIDLFPTLCAAAGVPLPEGVVYDGFDMLPVMQGKAASPRQEMFWQRRGDKAARVGNWKWVDSEAGAGLFDLASDIGEKTDLSEKRPEVLKRLKASFASWTDAMDRAEPRGPFRDY